LGKLLAELLDQLVPAQVGHVAVGDHQIIGNLSLLDCREAGLAVVDQDYLEPLPAEDSSNEFANARFVVHD
jgi:hypothetical protein